MVEQTASTQSNPAPDLNAVHAQTQPAALKLLDNARLGALLRELRAMKAGTGDMAAQRPLTQGIRRAAAERRERQEGAAASSDALAARQALKAAASDKAEEKARKQAEQAERKRAKEAERAEKKAAKAARKLVSVTRAEAKDKARDKKLALLGRTKGPAGQGQTEAGKHAAEGRSDAMSEAKLGPKPQPGKGKRGKNAAGKLGSVGQPKPAQTAAKGVAPAGDDEAPS